MKPGQSLAVFGSGTLGLSAIMAARISGAARIIAIDRHAHRLELAAELGADDTILAGNEAIDEQVLDLTGGGVDFTLDTTSVPEVMVQAIQVLAPRGTCAFVTGAWDGTPLPIPVRHLVGGGRMIRGIGEGGEFADRACGVHRPEARLQHLHRHIADPRAHGFRAAPEGIDQFQVSGRKATEAPRRRDGRHCGYGGEGRRAQRQAAAQAIADQDGWTRQRGEQRQQPVGHMRVQAEHCILGARRAPIDQIGVMSCCGHVAQQGTLVRQVQNARRIDQRRDEDDRKAVVFRAMLQQSRRARRGDAASGWQRRGPLRGLIFAQALEGAATKRWITLCLAP